MFQIDDVELTLAEGNVSAKYVGSHEKRMKNIQLQQNWPTNRALQCVCTTAFT